MRTIQILIFTVSLAVAFNARTITAATVQECDVQSLPTTSEQLQNPGQEPIVFLSAKGVRVYNCSTGVPSLNSGGLVNITDGGLVGANGSKSNWTGVGYYPDSEGNGTFALTEINSTTGAPLGKEFFLTLDYSAVEFVPAPDGAALDWARWNIFTVPRTIQEELGIGWGSRVDTVGGATPRDCSNIFANNSVVVDYTATYYFYPCPSKKSNDSSLAPVENKAEQAPSAANIASAPALLLSLVLLSSIAAVNF